jgi:hypothetical protein
VFDLIKQHPRLLTAPELWIGSLELQLALASHLPSVMDESVPGAELTQAILRANAWPALSSVLARYGSEAVQTVLAWVDDVQETEVSVPDLVSSALYEQRHLLIDIVKLQRLSPRALCLISSILDPRNEAVKLLGTWAWRSLAATQVRLTAPDAQLRSDAFLLSLGFSLSEFGDVELVRKGFSSIYSAARDNFLNDEVWRYVEPYLPWYLVTWDRCARLVRGAVRLFLDRGWPVYEFVATFQTEEQFRRALMEAEGSARGYRFIVEMCGLLNRGLITVDAIHEQALRPYREFR